jgi:hypothetical protein
MLGKQFADYILRKRPEYALKHKKLIEVLANQGHQAGIYTSFGPVYQIYMYGFFLGIHNDCRIPLPTAKAERKEFYELDKWSPKEMVNYILMMVISKPKELGFEQWADLEDLEEQDLKAVGDNIILLIEEYANGGLTYLEDYYERNKQEFEDPFVFIKILKNVVDRKKKVSKLKTEKKESEMI